MVTEDASVSYADHPRTQAGRHDRTKDPWRGITVYYAAEPPKTKDLHFADTPEGLVSVWLTEEERHIFQDTYDHWTRVHDVNVLMMKNGGKELDPRRFDVNEKRAFSRADADE